jgi:hypothetical protein
MTSARAELAAQQRAAALAADYHNGLRLFDAGRWEEAVAAFERITRLDSTYQDVPALLGRSRREVEKASGTLAEERAQREAEEQARRHAEEHNRARRQKEAEDHARRLGEEQARRIEEEAVRRLRKEQRRRDTHQMLRSLRQRTARLLSRRWGVIVAVSVGIGGTLLVLTYVLWTPPIMDQLPADLRPSCRAKGTSATCSLPDRTTVLYRLFDTAAEARADVVNGNELAPNGTPCPPSALVETPIVCRYAVGVGAETGVAAFRQTVKPPEQFYGVRWNPDAHPQLSGAMFTKNATAQDWESLQSNWTRLAGMS